MYFEIINLINLTIFPEFLEANRKNSKRISESRRNVTHGIV